MAIEANFSSYPIKRLEQLLYPRQYVREKEDNFTHKTDLSYGFKTTSVTRPISISGLVEAVRKKPEILNDRETILEMLSFIRNEAGRPEAESGAHDDCVMSLAIANYCTGGTQIYDKSSWTADMIKDYHNASYKDKKTLLKKWK